LIPFYYFFKFNSNLKNLNIKNLSQKNWQFQDSEFMNVELKNAGIKNLVLLLHVNNELRFIRRQCGKTFVDNVYDRDWFHFGTRALVPLRLPQRSAAASTVARRAVAVLGTGTGKLNAPSNFTCIHATVFSSRSRANTASLQMFSIRHIKIIVYTIHRDRQKLFTIKCEFLTKNKNMYILFLGKCFQSLKSERNAWSNRVLVRNCNGIPTYLRIFWLQLRDSPPER